ncbi:phenoloxidase-activating factor 1-like [Drosophila teissieri]|uniref:phenoloxidase-activating factor 1-like n=1 Tax=Drosophila teissieri TaxID=7243 RepID=UPI001CBA47F2|nr:phenoloxidase-activating factor 1-like [Drosophila teissieri]
MSSRTLPLLLLCSFLAFAKQSSESIEEMIEGGVAAASQEFKPAARLGHRNSTSNETMWFCGGTIISDRVILTAAHCFYSDVGSINIVRLGDLVFGSDKDDAQPEDFEVLETKAHPHFRYPALYNDIGLVRLRGEIRYNRYKLPACLPSSNGDISDHFTAIGWGQRKFSKFGQSRELRKVVLRNYGSSCASTFDANEDVPEGYKAESQLCVGSPDHKGTCNGDSGGPLLVPHAGHGCQYQVMGITSVGVACGTPNIPSLYTRVHFFKDWINAEMLANV